MKFLISVEALKLKAYKCPAGVWTVGIGNTFYKDGRAVKEGDIITKDEALQLGEVIAAGFIKRVKEKVTTVINDNQLIALVSFCYNIGKEGFSKSQILKMVNVNPNDPAIKARFLISFITAGGKPCGGLVNRRQIEANQYFK